MHINISASLSVGVYAILLLGCTKNTSIKSEKFEMSLDCSCEIEYHPDYFVIDDIDTIKYHFGITIDALTELDPNVIYIPEMPDGPQEDEYVGKIDSLPNTVVTRKRNFDLDDFRKQNVSYTIVDEYRAKIVYPREQIGITGIYIDSVAYGCVGDICSNISFHMYGENISHYLQPKLIEGFKTIDFSPYRATH